MLQSDRRLRLLRFGILRRFLPNVVDVVSDVLASVDTGGVTLAKMEAAGAATVMHPLLSVVRRPLSAELHEEMFALLNARLAHAVPPSGQRQTQQQGTQYTAGV